MEKEKLFSAENCRMTETKFDMTAVADGGGEYTMPDYYPEIRKIVSCNAIALPDTKFLSGDTLEFGGTLAFTVLYIGEDGALVSLPYSTEYEGKVRLPSDVRGTGEVFVDSMAEDIQCRVLAPRRISLKARVRSNISADEEKEYKVVLTDTDEAAPTVSDRASVQYLQKKIPVMSAGRGNATGKTSGELRERTGSKPVSCSGSINITEVKCKKDTVMVKGDAVIRCMIFTPEGVYSQVRTALPFEESVPAQGCAEGDNCRAWGRIASVTLSEGNEGHLIADAEYDLDAGWCRRGEVSVTEDAYSTHWAVAVERTELETLSPVCCCVSPLTVSGSGKRTTKPIEGEYLVDMTSDAYLTGVQQKEGKVILSGKCNIKVYIAGNGEVVCEEVELPIKYETDALTEPSEGKLLLRSSVSATDISGRLEGDSVYANCELCISADARRISKLSPVSKIVMDKKRPIGGDTAQLKVFYPSNGETLWEISKMYSAPAHKIEALNGCDRHKKPGAPVLIPQW